MALGGIGKKVLNDMNNGVDNILMDKVYFKEGHMCLFQGGNMNKSKLCYGTEYQYLKVKEPEHPWVIQLTLLDVLENISFPFIYHNIGHMTLARKTLFGGLRVKRSSKILSQSFSKFSPKDYKVIRKKIEEILEHDAV